MAIADSEITGHVRTQKERVNAAEGQCSRGTHEGDQGSVSEARDRHDRTGRELYKQTSRRCREQREDMIVLSET